MNKMGHLSHDNGDDVKRVSEWITHMQEQRIQTFAAAKAGAGFC